MSQIKKTYASLSELKNIYALTAIAMLLALRVVLGMFANATLPMFGNTIKISAAFMPIAVCGAMFGPIPALLVGALGDIISFVISPMGAYFPGWTISGALTGFIFGYMFYKCDISIFRVIIAWVANTLIAETFLAAFWLFISMGFPYAPTLLARFISQSVKAIPEMAILFGLGKLCSKINFSQFGLKSNKG